MSTTEELFAEAIKDQDEKKKKASESKGGNFSFEWVDVEYLGMELDILKAFRIIGVPFNVRRNAFDPKAVLMSQILKDDKKSFQKVIWPIDPVELQEKGKYKPDPNWIFTRLTDAIQESKWTDYEKEDVGKKDERGDDIVESSEGKIVNDRTSYEGRYVPIHQEKTCFKMLRDNFIISKKSNNKISNNTYPSVRVIMQVLDRMDDWCKKNKKYKVLTNNLNISNFTDKEGIEQQRSYADTGISKTAYDKIFKHFMRFRKDWFIDVVVCKTKTNNMYDWEIYDATDSAKLPDNIKPIVSDGPLTKEEENYENNDLDKICGVTPALSLKKNHEAKFRAADLELGTNFLQELDVLCKKEKEEWIEKNKDKKEEAKPAEEVKTSNEGNNIVENDQPPVQEEEKSEPTTRVERSGTDREMTSFESFPFWNNLDDLDKKDVESFSIGINEGKITYKEGAGLLNCDNPECKELLPNTVKNCPYCGMHFGDE